jgi:Domain of unknown function (DUF1990)
MGWTKLCWPDVPITAGTVVGVLGRHFGLWSLNACRIVYVIEEERFTVEWRRAEDSVFYEVFAFARPAHPLARVGPRFVQLVQRRFAGLPPCGPWLRPITAPSSSQEGAAPPLENLCNSSSSPSWAS